MKTIEYPYFQCDFSEFNKAQQAVVPFFDKDVNLVLALNTGVGKTAIAECIFGYHLTTEQKSKVVYVSPFKSIGSEKLTKWSKNNQFKAHGILLCNGDSQPKPDEWKSKRLIVITYESFDSKSRNKDVSWINDISCVVFDEAHMLGQEDRGSKIEACLMRITSINPKARIIFLSGTMGNSVELAKWIKMLNGKETRCIQSDWKPVKTILNFHQYDDTIGFKKSEQEKLQTFYSLIKNIVRNEKILVFVHSKRMGKVLIDFLKTKKIKCAFHNSSVPANIRKQMEEAFSDDNSGFNVLVSTSTLSAGINL